MYSISINGPLVSDKNIGLVKSQLENWLSKSQLHHLPTYRIATLIIHEGREGCFAIINWWIDENMLQNFVYLKKDGDTDFVLLSDTGITTCVWELAVWWHERNAWVNHVMLNHQHPDFEAYLQDGLNIDI